MAEMKQHSTFRASPHEFDLTADIVDIVVRYPARYDILRPEPWSPPAEEVALPTQAASRETPAPEQAAKTKEMH